VTATLDLRPLRGCHLPETLVVLLVESPVGGRAEVVVERLGATVHRSTYEIGPGRAELSLGTFARGSYGVVLSLDGGVATSAFDVVDSPDERPRYGFVTDFRPGRDDAAEVADSLRAFHLTHVQFYDWMYRHAELLPPTDEFTDTLGRTLSLEVVRDFVAATHAAGARALAYAAVYAAGREYAAAHPEQVVTHPDGTPWMLGDFLWNTDLRPGSAWTTHIVEQMGSALDAVPFDGLHLDQYGDPKLAVASDGGLVDYTTAFPAFIGAVRARLPEATLIFNNVNDYPTRSTIRSAQDTTYIEVWSPHDDHGDLVDLVRRARDLAPDRPVILAAYLEPFAAACGPAEIAAAKLALATTWAEGGQYLLFGECHGVLVHPYYPNYATLTDEATSALRPFADFAVAVGDLLFDSAVLDVRGAPITLRPRHGSVWVRVAASGRRLVIQLVDFRAQTDDRWNAPRQETETCAGVEVSVRIASDEVQAVFGHPMGGPVLHELPVDEQGDRVVVSLPPFDTWGVLVIDR
jgi:dextranase